MIARRGGALALICLISGFVAGCGENPSPTPAIVAPAISVLGNLMKHFRHPPAASPVTPTAGTGMPRDPGAGSRDAA